MQYDVQFNIHYQNRSNFDQHTSTKKRRPGFHRNCFFCIPSIPSTDSISRGISTESSIYVNVQSPFGNDFIEQPVTIHSIGFPYVSDISSILHYQAISVPENVLKRYCNQKSKKDLTISSESLYASYHESIEQYNNKVASNKETFNYTISNDILNDTLSLTMTISNSLMSTL